MRGESGQATVEFVALLPLMAIVALVVLQLLTGYGAREAADQAAVAGAVAQLQATDPKVAVKEASPGWARGTVTVRKGRVTVRMVPRLPGFIAGRVDAERSVVFDAAAAR